MNSFLGQHSLSEKILHLEDTLTKKDLTDSQVCIFMKTKFSTSAHVHLIYIYMYQYTTYFRSCPWTNPLCISTVPDSIKFTYYDGNYILIR